MTQITLLDGGMGQELLRRSGDAPSPLWSTQVMTDHPGLVAEIHLDYADAGATVATTNSYAIHRDRLRGGASNHYASEGMDLPDMQDQLIPLLRTALTEAASVRGRSRVAGSIGPLGASYRADLHPGFDEAVPLYAEIVQTLAPGCDLLLFETIASVEAARSCLAAGRSTDLPVWLALTVDDEDGSKLRSGEPISEALPVLRDADAVLANCSAPEAMAAALGALEAAGRPMGAYANAFAILTKAFIQGGTTTADLQHRADLTPPTYADFAMDWVARGATILGGCCETTPDHIREIAIRLRAQGHTIT